MAAVTTRTKFLVFFSFLLISCGEKINITEFELIDGMDTQRFVRVNNYSGTITITYIDDVTIKSKRRYLKGKKNGVHEGWWPNGNKKYLYYFKEDQSFGTHKQWHSNGELFTLKNFKTGVEHGEQKSWDQNGELMYKYIYDNGRKYGIQGSIICNGGNELEVLN